MVGTVEASRRPVSRLQQVDPPDRLADLDRLGRLDGAFQLTPGEQPDLQPDAPLGALLAFERMWVNKVQVTQHNSGPLESEDIQHGRASSEDGTLDHLATWPPGHAGRRDAGMLPVCVRPPCPQCPARGL